MKKPSTRAALEAALADDPDDLAAHHAYADLLTEEGDPRGEFIRVQLALDDPACKGKKRKALQQREQDLLQDHQQEWLGELAPYIAEKTAVLVGEKARFSGNCDYQIRFARGWLASLQVYELSLEFAVRLAHAPEARLLLRLDVVSECCEEEIPEKQLRKYGIPVPIRDCFPGCFPLRRAPWLANLRVFQLGDFPNEPVPGSERWAEGVWYPPNFRCQIGGSSEAVELIGRMSRVEELYLFAGGFPTEGLFRLHTLSRLRVLQLYHAHHYPLELLAENPTVGRLTHLLLHPKAAGDWSDDTPYIKFDGVRAMLHSPHLKSLTHLRLRLTDIGDRGCEEIVRSGILKRLKMLDLRHGIVTDEGARILAACPDVAKLELLELSRNRVTAAGLKRLRAVTRKVWADSPLSEGDVETGEFLYEGDIE